MLEEKGTPRAESSVVETMGMDHLENSSVIGRLLEELSWEGESVRAYRDGGRGRENVLTAEALWPLSCLPRNAFLAEVLRHAHGAAVRLHVADEAEEAEVTLLPDQIELGPERIVVQPDATLVTPGTYVLVEAKRIRRSSFQVNQLPREMVALMSRTGDRLPLLLLVLGAPPPVAVAGRGRLPLQEALTAGLADVLANTPEVDTTVDDLIHQLPEIVAWITWAEIAEVTRRQGELFRAAPHGLAGTVRRLTAAVTEAIEWHK